jgi:hypothetical protein
MKKVLFKYEEWKSPSICYECDSDEGIAEMLGKIGYKFKRDMFYFTSDIKKLQDGLKPLFGYNDGHSDDDEFRRYFEEIYNQEVITEIFDRKYITAHRKYLEEHGKFYYNSIGGVHIADTKTEIREIKR